MTPLQKRLAKTGKVLGIAALSHLRGYISYRHFKEASGF